MLSVSEWETSFCPCSLAHCDGYKHSQLVSMVSAACLGVHQRQLAVKLSVNELETQHWRPCFLAHWRHPQLMVHWVRWWWPWDTVSHVSKQLTWGTAWDGSSDWQSMSLPSMTKLQGECHCINGLANGIHLHAVRIARPYQNVGTVSVGCLSCRHWKW